jgi:hypothetical protein
MSDPIRPVDSIVAAARSFGTELPASPRGAPVGVALDPEAIVVAAAALAAAAPPAPGADLLLVGVPTPALNPALPELLAARARLLLRPDEETEDLPPERDAPEREPREPALPPDQEDDAPAP